MSKWNDFLKDYKKRNPDKTLKQCMKDASKEYREQNGTGRLADILDMALNPDKYKNTVDEGSAILKKIQEKNRLKNEERQRLNRQQHGFGFIDNIANKLLSTKENKLLPGEKHQMIKMPDGRIAPTVYSGPGTQLETRIRRGDKPLSYVDKTAQAHDIRYQLAKTEADVKKADADMIVNLDKAKAQNLDNLFNIRQAELIKMKYLLQDKFGVPTSFFTTFGLDSIKDPTIIPIMESKLKELEQQGFGIKRKKKIY